MIYIETRIFTEDVVKFKVEEQLIELQKELILNPKKGELIVGAGGLRKVRMAGKGKGKSGGYRVIYYLKGEHIIFLIFIFSKSGQESLTKAQTKILRKLIEEG